MGKKKKENKCGDCGSAITTLDMICMINEITTIIQNIAVERIAEGNAGDTPIDLIRTIIDELQENYDEEKEFHN